MFATLRYQRNFTVPTNRLAISDVKTEFFSQPIIDLLKPVFTDKRNVITI